MIPGRSRNALNISVFIQKLWRWLRRKWVRLLLRCSGIVEWSWISAWRISEWFSVKNVLQNNERASKRSEWDSWFRMNVSSALLLSSSHTKKNVSIALCWCTSSNVFNVCRSHYLAPTNWNSTSKQRKHPTRCWVRRKFSLCFVRWYFIKHLKVV